MYVPDHFRLDDDHARTLLRTARAGNLVTVHEDGPDATLVPFFLDEDADQLVTHLVRNNPQARRRVTGPGLVVFDVADAYVSPLDHATNDALPNVPTWDHITVHVRGAVHVDDSAAAALAAARVLTSHFEDEDVLALVGEDRLERMARSIVAVRVDVERIEAKAKMSQNRHPDDVASIADALEARGEDELVRYLREVSLPHAIARHAMIRDLRATRNPGLDVTGRR